MSMRSNVMTILMPPNVWSALAEHQQQRLRELCLREDEFNI